MVEFGAHAFGGKSARPGVTCLADNARHRLEFVAGRLRVARAFAHDESTHRGVSNVRRGVDAEVTVQRVEVRGEGVP